jgi:hypothetical protein
VNLRQRIAAFTGLLVEAGMLLYPPWIMPNWRDDTYRFVFSPPQYLGAHDIIRNGVIDTQRLAFQCAIVAILTIAVVVLLGARKPQDSN